VNVTAKLIQHPLLDIIKTRRSIRRFKPDPISDDQLLTILEAARLAPTGENVCPWRFIIVKDPEKRRILTELGVRGARRRMGTDILSSRSGKFEEWYGHLPEDVKSKIFDRLKDAKFMSWLDEAPIHIIACTTKHAIDMREDLSAALENMLLMIHALGLGAVWVAAPVKDVREEEEVRKLLKIPPDIKPIAQICIGYPNQSPKERPKKPLEEVAFFEEWGKPLPFKKEE